jgi:hypothetical protein
MSGKRGSTTLGSEEIKPPPPNARWITFEQSDGDFSIRPEPRNPERDSSGKWNFFRQVPLDERQSTEWRRKIGNKLAEMLNYKGEEALSQSTTDLTVLVRPTNLLCQGMAQRI